MDIQLFAVDTWALDTERRTIDIANEIARYLVEENPWLTILLQSRKETTSDPEFKWWEEDVYGYWTQINFVAGYPLGTELTFAVDDETLFAPKDIVKVPRTGEVMQVVSTDPAHTITVAARGYGETAGAAMVNDDYFLNLGNAMEENSTAPAQKIKQPTKLFNYTQISRTPFGASRTVQQSRQVTTEQERSRLTRDKSLDHRLALERAYLFGERKEDALGKRRLTRGVLKFITTNVYDASGELTQAEFDKEVCEPVFKYGKKTKVMACSARMVSIVNGWAIQKLEVSQGAKEYGLDLREYVSPHGRLLLAPCRTFEQYYAYHSAIFDMPNIWLRTLQDTVLNRNIQPNDADGFIDEYLTEAGIQVRLEKAHAIIKNATA